jgi:NADPH-dependent curcumin reductase CurA
VIPLLNNFARIPLCGTISQYSATELPPAPDWAPTLLKTILVKRLTVRGFIVLDFHSEEPAFLRDMSTWLREGKVKYREDIVDGLENAVTAFQGLLCGRNFGKQLIRVASQ